MWSDYFDYLIKTLNLTEDFSNYILSLKQNLEIAVSLLPDSLFKRPIFFGKEDFYYREFNFVNSWYWRRILNPILI